jgi:hypothetical protein
MAMERRDLIAGFVRLHVLHHAAEHEVYGLWMIEELAGRLSRFQATSSAMERVPSGGE